MVAEKVPSVTIILPAGRLPLDELDQIREVAGDYALEFYFTVAQNLRLTGIQKDDLPAIKERLIVLGFQLKGPGKMLKPRACLGKDLCNLGQVETLEMTKKIVEAYGGGDNVKPKLKIALAGCAMGCSNPKTTDIGIIGSRNGCDMYVGGKGGITPTAGKRIGKDLTEDEALEMIGVLIDYHDKKPAKKIRLAKLMDEEDFPYPEV